MKKIAKVPDIKHVRLFNFSRKLLLLCVLPIILICFVITLLSTNILRRNLESEIRNASKIVAVSLEKTYSNLYEGDYSRDVGGRLYKGNTPISDDTKLLDALKEETGFESTLYFDNMTVITTVMLKAGGRSTGIKLDADVYKRVMAGEDVFEYDLTIQDVKFYAYFKPLRNLDGSVVGCIFTGKPSATVDKLISKETRKIAFYSSIIVFCAALLIFFLAKKISKTMEHTKKFLQIVSNGDLTQEPDRKNLKRNDELGDIYSSSFALQEDLKQIVSTIKESASDLSSSSDSLMDMSKKTLQNVDVLYNSIEAISNGASVQAQKTVLAASNTQKIGEQIDYIANEVDSLTVTATIMSSAEIESSNIVSELYQSNEELIQSIEKIAGQITSTNTSVQAIQIALAMIRSISEETDLLSINASIEAAHAGAAGSGFAVVATQISKLAAQSSGNAQEIEKTIKTLMDNFSHMIEIMEEVKQKIDNQRNNLNQTMNKFNAVAQGVQTSLENINYITNKMTELRESRDIIMDVINDLSSVSEQYSLTTRGTIKNAEEMSCTMTALEMASQKLKSMSDSLHADLDVFKIACS